jgi:hypothetical protein
VEEALSFLQSRIYYSFEAGSGVFRKAFKHPSAII